MDQEKTGARIRMLRQAQGLTQLALAQRLGVSDKAVSKWERGAGAPDISLLTALAEILGADLGALLRESTEENPLSNGNMKKTQFYVCPDCGNLLLSTDEAELSCCGKRLSALQPQAEHDDERIDMERNDEGWLLTSPHPMTREHSVQFAALLTGDGLFLKRLYPEWDLQTRLPYVPHGILLWYCTRHGLYRKLF